MRAAALCLLAVAALWPSRRLVGGGLAVAGAAGLVWSTWAASFQHRDNQWAVGAAVVVVAAQWWAAPRVHVRLSRAGGAWGLLFGSAIAVYGCVPETDQMREVAVVVCAGGLVEALRRRPLPNPALLAASGLVAWSALYGATGRPSALVGGLFALLPFIAVASTPSRRWWLPWLVGLVWSGAAVGVARTGGIATELSTAVAWAAAFGGAALAVTLAVYAVSAKRAVRPLAG